jgi:hypothetical protein
MEDSRGNCDGRSERSVPKRKRIPAPGGTFGEDQSFAWPDGVMWPSAGFAANQYSPAGEVVVFASLFRGLQRRWRRRREG